MTDTISVRVVGSVPDVLNVKPINGSVFIYPDQDLSFDYENVEYLTITIRYTDKDDVEHIIPLLEKDDPESFVGYIPGSYSTPLDLLAEDYGYGEYRVEIVGIGFDDIKDFETIEFAFYPVAVALQIAYSEANQFVVLGHSKHERLHETEACEEAVCLTGLEP